MFAYVVKRLLSGVVVLFLVSMTIFLVFWYGPQEPAQVVCDRQTSNRCGERIELYRENLGYNNAWYEEYGTFLKGIAVGRDIKFGNRELSCAAPCLGRSYLNDAPVWEEMKTRMPATFSVAIGGAALYLLLGIPIGIAAARRRGTLADKALVSSFLVISSIPYYLFALLVWLFLTISWEIPLFAETGYFPLTDNPAKWFSGLFLAWIALGVFGCTSYTRYTRGSMVEVLGEDYIRTAKAKGLASTKVVYKHGLRSALVPVVTIFGIDFGTLLAGTIFTEQIFDIEGIGRWALNAVYQRDLPVVAATALFGATILIISNLIVDVVYSILDPRVRFS
ncbi:ABC transporter permease [Nocardioides antri]|uniref:ABC transporter permease n=1 Tax=Nocardioides antri TaxID=2607659 RepID=A0A5B1LVH4_9ACTN|nr:ABC transporter permease [Nocardioides antri]KAA1424138.1 ABC transporter permease [Nocardioides antri]